MGGQYPDKTNFYLFVSPPTKSRVLTGANLLAILSSFSNPAHVPAIAIQSYPGRFEEIF
jgi:hypothetical protein